MHACMVWRSLGELQMGLDAVLNKRGSPAGVELSCGCGSEICVLYLYPSLLSWVETLDR
jgi:hypothetical protein